MKPLIPKEKLSKKARKELDSQRRTLWQVQPVTKKIESKKLYNRKKARRLNQDDLGLRLFLCSRGKSCLSQ